MFSLCIVELILYSLNFHKLEVRSRGVWLRYRLSILSSSFIDNSVQKSLKVSVMVISPIFAFPAKELVMFPREPWLLLVGNSRVYSLGTKGFFKLEVYSWPLNKLELGCQPFIYRVPTPMDSTSCSCVVLQAILIEENPMCKWTHAVQTHVLQVICI